MGVFSFLPIPWTITCSSLSKFEATFFWSSLSSRLCIYNIFNFPMAHVPIWVLTRTKWGVSFIPIHWTISCAILSINEATFLRSSLKQLSLEGLLKALVFTTFSNFRWLETYGCVFIHTQPWTMTCLVLSKIESIFLWSLLPSRLCIYNIFKLPMGHKNIRVLRRTI